MKKINIMLVDDHAVMRQGLASLIGANPAFTVVGQANSGEDAVRQAKELKPDFIIMDLMMPGIDGAEAVRFIKAAHPEIRILLLTTFGSADRLSKAMDFGADGAMLKSADFDDLIGSIKRIMAGEKVLAPEIRRIIAEDPPVAELTPRQQEILESIVRGLTNDDIARRYSINLCTVKDHVNAILQKLGAANRTEALSIAIRKHLVRI